MSPSLALVVGILAAPTATLPTDFRPVSLGTPRRDRAVVLIHGLKLFPLRPAKAGRPEPHDWQEPTGDCVRTLGSTFDVFTFCYGQTVPVDAIAHTPALRAAVDGLRAGGYTDVVVVGHSCGGLIGRLFVEAYPDGGITKVIQVASPNGGSDLAVVKAGYHRIQAAMVESCVPSVRRAMAVKSHRLVPPKVEFAAVVCRLPGFAGDGVVWAHSAWPDDLQRQGVPAVTVLTGHIEALKCPNGVRAVNGLVREKLTRWSPDEVEQARRALFKDDHKTSFGRPSP